MWGDQLYSIQVHKCSEVKNLQTGLPAALGRGQVGGGVWKHLGALGGIPTHICMHMYTCIEIANGH